MVDDELNQDQSPILEGEEPVDDQVARITELESLVAQRDEELARTSSRLSELEQQVAESAEKLDSTNQSLNEALASYKAMVIEANPEVPAELISGESIETVNESLRQAKDMISRVRQGMEAEILAVKVPAGAPPRRPPDLSALSPRDKIQYAIGGKR